jgi:hypothetical protein
MLLLLFPISLYRVPGAAQTREKPALPLRINRFFAVQHLRGFAKWLNYEHRKGAA